MSDGHEERVFSQLKLMKSTITQTLGELRMRGIYC